MDAPPVRVLFIVDGRYPATGGAEMQARLLARELSRAGHSVRILAPRVDDSQSLRERIDGVDVTRLSYPRIKGLGAVVLNLRLALWLWRNKGDIDAIHVHMMHNLAGAIGWLKPWLRVPVTVKVSGAAEFQGGVLDPELRGRVKHRVLNAGARRLEAFQCISRHTLHMLREAGYPSDRLFLVPNAVDCDRFGAVQQEPQSALRVVFVGRHAPVKALDVLLRAWAELARPVDARLILVGDGPETAALRRLAVELCISDSVVFPGMLSDVAPELRRASIYVQPSLQEGLPNAVLEAMAAHLPVVATRVSGNEDVVDHGRSGLLVPPGDVQALAAALQCLLDEPALRARLGQAAAEDVRHGFATDQVVASLLKIYRRRGA